MPTSERIEKVSRVLAHRQADLRVVLEGVTNAHNASAVMRTCDAAGVLNLDLIAPNPELLRPNKAISTRADKWLEIAVHATPAACLEPLKKAAGAPRVDTIFLSADDVRNVKWIRVRMD